MGENKRGKIVDARITDPDDGEVLGEFRAIHVRAPRSVYGSEFYMTAQAPLDHLVDIRHEIGFECTWVLIKLQRKLDFQNLIQVSPAAIAREMGMRRQNVSRCIKRLVGLNILIEGGKVGIYRSYRLNPELGWKGSSADLHRAMREHRKKPHLKLVTD